MLINSTFNGSPFLFCTKAENAFEYFYRRSSEMNSFKTALARANDKAMNAAASALVAASDLTGRAMNTRWGKTALIVPAAISMMSVRVSAAEVDAQGMIDGIMGVLGPGVIALGSLVAVVGGIQTGVAFKDDNPDGKTRGFMTLIGGAIIAAVGALVPESISLGG